MNDLTSGASFYSEPHPERIGSPVLKDQQHALDNVIQMPQQSAPPPYQQETYASQEWSAPRVESLGATGAVYTGIPGWMWLAAGAILVLALRGDQQ